MPYDYVPAHDVKKGFRIFLPAKDLRGKIRD
jgi:hypothetical protein